MQDLDVPPSNGNAMPALDTLNESRRARGEGDIALCSVRAAAAISEAMHENEPETAYHAAACVGRAHMGRMDPSLALGHYRHALDIALTHALMPWVGPAQHDLALALRESGNFKGFKERSAVAFTIYRDTDPRHPGITGILADLAQAEFDRHPEDRDKVAYCLQAWRSVPVSMPTPHYRLNAAANQMQAAAVLGVRCRYDSARHQLDTFYGELPSMEHAALTLAHAGRAALLMKDFEDAAFLAERALLLAESRDEDAPADLAREVRSAALAERSVAVA